MIYLISGLLDEESKPIYYAQAKTNVECLEEVAKALDKGANIILIRKIG